MRYKTAATFTLIVFFWLSSHYFGGLQPNNKSTNYEIKKEINKMVIFLFKDRY